MKEYFKPQTELLNIELIKGVLDGSPWKIKGGGDPDEAHAPKRLKYL